VGTVMSATSRRDSRKEDKLIFPSVFAAFLAALALTILPTGTLQAVEDDCIDAPNAQAPQGSHWYYRLDRANQRKCWYLAPKRKTSQKVAPVEKPIVQSIAPPEAHSPVNRSVPHMEAEPSTNQTWPEATVNQTIGAAAPDAKLLDSPHTTGAFLRGRIVVSDAASGDHAAAPAREAEAAQAPAHQPFTDISDKPDSSQKTDSPAPLDALLHVLLLLAGALAFAGLVLRTMFKINAVRCRRNRYRSRAALMGSPARTNGQHTATFASALSPPRPVAEHIDPDCNLAATDLASGRTPVGPSVRESGVLDTSLYGAGASDIALSPDCNNVAAGNWSVESFEREFAHRLGIGHRFDRRPDLGIDENLSIARFPAEPGSEIDDGTDRRIIVSPFETDPAERRISVRNADPEAELVAELAPFELEGGDTVTHLDRHPHGLSRRIGAW
jgi:hypothetical protein